MKLTPVRDLKTSLNDCSLLYRPIQQARSLHVFVCESLSACQLSSTDDALAVLGVKPSWLQTLTLQSHQQFARIRPVHNNASQATAYQWFIHSLISKSCFEECAASSLPSSTRPRGVILVPGETWNWPTFCRWVTWQHMGTTKPYGWNEQLL